LKTNYIRLNNFIQVGSYFGCNLSYTGFQTFYDFFDLLLPGLYDNLISSFIVPTSIDEHTINYLGFYFNECNLMLEECSKINDDDEGKRINHACLKRYDVWLKEGKISCETHSMILRLVILEKQRMIHREQGIYNHNIVSEMEKLREKLYKKRN
jgi:hypothetical protein